jgi:hypothetical protein
MPTFAFLPSPTTLAELPSLMAECSPTEYNLIYSHSFGNALDARLL